MVVLVFFWALFSLLLVGCDKKDKVPLVGNRERVFMPEEHVIPDKTLKDTQVILPAAVNHLDWPMVYGNAAHLVKPGLLNASLQKKWEAQVGTAGFFRGFGSRSFFQPAPSRLLNGPIAADGKVFTIDARGFVVATDLKTGERVWAVETVSMSTSASEQFFGGGLAYEGHQIYAATAHAEVLAIEGRTGKILWRSSASAPIRSAPAVKDGRVFVININNQLEVFDAAQGHLLWTHMGTVESASLLGGASPAIGEGVVVVPYSSGEVFALRVENGYPLWSENLAGTRRLDSLSSIAHIKAAPVIDRNLVFLVGYNGRLSAVDLPSGKTVWSKPVGGSLHTPAVAGPFLFVLTTKNNLVCLKRETGQIVWVQPLPQEGTPASSEGKVLWSGPILTENALIVTGSQGHALVLKAQDGQKVSGFEMQQSLSLPPILVDQTLVFLTDSASLVAYR